MLGNMSQIGEMLDVDLKIVYIDRLEESVEEIERLKRKGVDLIIGGKIISQNANSMGIPTLQYVGTEDSIIEAIEEANRLQYALEVEKKSDAQLESILDTTFNGIIKINSEGNIIVINRPIENLIGMEQVEVVGRQAKDIFPEFDENNLKAILTGEKEHYIISVNIRNQAWILNAAPIQYNDRITGAILSLQKVTETRRSITDAHKKWF